MNSKCFDFINGKYRSLYPRNSKETLRILQKHPKQIHKANPIILTPGDTSWVNDYTFTELQQDCIKHSKFANVYGNYLYCCPCGSGKTIGGILWIMKKSCKTLIISTRSAVNEQWEINCKRFFPSLNIKTATDSSVKDDKRCKLIDILIATPQFLIKNLYVFDSFQPGLIIYDEIHSLLSESFCNVLRYPFTRGLDKMKKITIQGVTMNIVDYISSFDQFELPFMVGLTATLPPPGKDGNLKFLHSIFGRPYTYSSKILDIPVYVWDYKNHYHEEGITLNTKTSKEAMIKSKQKRGYLDFSYNPVCNQYDIVDYFVRELREVKKSEEFSEVGVMSTEFKGIVMTYTIASSYYAALKFAMEYRVNVALVRTLEESSYIIPGRCLRENVDEESVNEEEDNNEYVNEEEDNNEYVNEEEDNNDCVNEEEDNYESENESNDNKLNKANIIRKAIQDRLKLFSIPCDCVKCTEYKEKFLSRHSEEQWERLTVKRDSECDVIPVLPKQWEVKPHKEGRKHIYPPPQEYTKDCELIVGTVHRLKEGFSVQNITLGVCTQFVYSIISRVQILGRIRRLAPEGHNLNQMKRVFFVYSHRSPIKKTMEGKPYIDYDYKYENNMFEKEKYIYI